MHYYVLHGAVAGGSPPPPPPPPGGAVTCATCTGLGQVTPFSWTVVITGCTSAATVFNRTWIATQTAVACIWLTATIDGARIMISFITAPGGFDLLVQGESAAGDFSVEASPGSCLYDAPVALSWSYSSAAMSLAMAVALVTATSSEA